MLVRQHRKLFRLAAERGDLQFAVQFADGGSVRADGEADFTLVFRTLAAELRTALLGHIGLIESYVRGEVEVEGSLARAFAFGLQIGFDRPSPLVRLLNRWHEWRCSNESWEQAKRNARFHYGLGEPFYRLWLDDPLKMYTCAYWREGTRTLEEAQANKIDHVCRKLRLQPGEEVLDIGCGFGGFMFRAREQCGVRVTGINTATEQVEWLQGEIGRRALGAELQVIETDFRDARREYDKVASIGVLEHAGRDQLEAVVRSHARSLKHGGLGVLHFIGHVDAFDTEYFIRHYVFPGGWIPSLAQTLAAMDRAGLEVIDVENLRCHYALTLDAWAERFERRWDAIRALDAARFTERFRRIWLAYLHGCAEMFRSPRGRTHLFQIVFARGNAARQSYPMSRAFLYR